jgi:hypothetical protein
MNLRKLNDELQNRGVKACTVQLDGSKYTVTCGIPALTEEPSDKKDEGDINQLIDEAVLLSKSLRFTEYVCSDVTVDKASEKCWKAIKSTALSGNLWSRIWSVFKIVVAKDTAGLDRWIKSNISDVAGYKVYRSEKVTTTCVASPKGELLIWRGEEFCLDKKTKAVIINPYKCKFRIRKSENVVDVREFASKILLLDKNAIGKRHMCRYLFGTDIPSEQVRSQRGLDWSKWTDAHLEACVIDTICPLVSFLVLNRIKPLSQNIETVFL